MAHDVFISYSSVDKNAADTVCSILEQNGTSCWIAPRDITPGLDFAEAIIDGIKSSKLFLLVYTSSSNNSKQVIREVDRAVHFGLQVINLRLEDVPMSKQLDYYLSSVHWLEAMTPPLEQHIHQLCNVIQILLKPEEVKDVEIAEALRKGIIKLEERVEIGKRSNVTKNQQDDTAIEKSIAVLPFINDSPDQENTYFINGVMEEILNNLQKIKDLRVISRTSVEQYRESKTPVNKIAKELDVNYIVEGSGQKYGNAFRLRTQLIAADRETHLWGESFQQQIINVEDIFNIQIKIATSIAEELKALISPEEKRLIEKIPAADLAVYDEYLKARSYWDDFTKESLFKALDYLNSGVEKDPEWAPLYAGITQVWMTIQQMGFESPSVAAPKILENLNKALELDPDLSNVHFISAMIAHLMEWDWEKSEKEFLKALAINPGDAFSRMCYAQLLAVLHRNNEALTQGHLAMSMDPLNSSMKMLYGWLLLAVGDCRSSLSVGEEALAADPGNWVHYTTIETAAYRCKEYDKVIKAVRYALPIPIEEDEYKEIERIYHEHGIASAYEELMKLLEKFAQNNPITFMDLAMRYVYANNPDKAMEWIEKGLEMHDPQMTYITTLGYNLDPLFKIPRFIEIAEQMNLPLPKAD